MLYITKKIYEQIEYLHRSLPGKEWSGILLYRIDSGLLRNAEEPMKLTAIELYLMDIGSATYTEYLSNPADIVDLYDQVPGLLDGDVKIGHIHSHHNMSAYFSGTDNDELEDNAINHNMYLSLIVNNAKTYVAKIAMHAVETVEMSVKTRFKDADEHPLVIPETRQVTTPVLAIVPLDIQHEVITEEVDDTFRQRFETLKSRPQPTPAYRSYSPPAGDTYAGVPARGEQSVRRQDMGMASGRRISIPTKLSNKAIMQLSGYNVPFPVTPTKSTLSKFVAMLLTADLDQPWTQVTNATKRLKKIVRDKSAEEEYKFCMRISDSWTVKFLSYAAGRATDFPLTKSKSQKLLIPTDVLQNAYVTLIDNLINDAVDMIGNMDFLSDTVRLEFMTALTDIQTIDAF